MIRCDSLSLHYSFILERQYLYQRVAVFPFTMSSPYLNACYVKDFSTYGIDGVAYRVIKPFRLRREHKHILVDRREREREGAREHSRESDDT